MPIDQWELELAPASEEDRRSHLEATTSFAVIVSDIGKSMTVLCCHPEPCDRAAGFRRVIYCVKVRAPLFDQFFNSRHGYRAAYFRSPHEGLQANSLLLRSLLPSLLASGRTRDCPESPAFIRESLTSESAKGWLAEPNPGFCPLCDGEWVSPPPGLTEIRNGRWEVDTCQNALWGRTAPYLTKIRLFGAFLNDGLDEFIPSRKRRRAWDIHEWGWS